MVVPAVSREPIVEAKGDQVFGLDGSPAEKSSGYQIFISDEHLALLIST